ncbi:MAG: DUF1549 and DUF1553 domain-containing protein [Bryobacteraceae bacterium]
MLRLVPVLRRFLVIGLCPLALLPAQEPGIEFFEKKIRPILATHCYGCHSANEKVVDRLLASPHYGERWARHWLDLARFAETDGHEFDREKPNAWRYRDYAIRAFNEDLPYDDFVREQLAGDLLPARRMAPGGTHWETPVGTSLYGLGEERNAADDLGEVRADKIENQIDVLGKTFLGLTVACARCHDHKFDPIPTRDYYALAGIFDSKQVIQACLDAPSKVRETERIHGELVSVNQEMDSLLSAKRPAVARGVKTYLQAALEIHALDEKEAEEASLKQVSSAREVDPLVLKAWHAEMGHAASEPDHILFPLAKLAKPDEKSAPLPFSERLQAIRQELADWTAKSSPDHPIHAERGDRLLADFAAGINKNWRVDGPAFSGGPAAFVPPQQALQGYQGRSLANSFRGGADALVGYLTSPSLIADKRYFHVRLAGHRDSTSTRQPGQLRVSLVGDGRDAALTADPSGRLMWKSSGLGKMFGERVYVEIVDRSPTGHIVVDKMLLSDSKEPPFLGRTPNRRVARMLEDAALESIEQVVQGYQRLFAQAAEEKEPDVDGRWLVHALSPVALDRAPLEFSDAEKTRIQALQRQRADLASRLPEPAFGMQAVDDKPHNFRLHIAGSHKNLGPEVPRGFLKVLSDESEPIDEGSGRLQLAEAIARPDNPLTARVLVNRIWKHHFREGLVRTPDNFGRTGERPTHPELLDTLAARFVEGGWSMKKLHRALVLSSTYRMSSAPDPKAVAVDGENRLLHHMPVRRLEAEAIRDAILSVTGTLDRAVYGPSIPPFISEYQDGRGKPATGPLDGDGRRSVYIGVRRNFLTPMLLAFDYPMSVTTIGRRGSSTVPSQALILMNNEFVARQAAKWTDRLIGAHPNRQERIGQMFLTAFGRPVEASEVAKIIAFLDQQKNRHNEDGNAEFRAWADLAHVLLNSKEFIFIR